MAGLYDEIDGEIAAGRLWRAREMLSGRLRDTPYDAELFRRYAGVLAAMRDDDAAGRYFLLAGANDGDGGVLARAFLARRKRRSIAALWATMPASARRVDAGGMLPAGTVALLKEAGYDAQAIDRQTAAKRPSAMRQSRKLRLPGRGATAFAWVVLGLLCVIGALGLLRLIDIVVDVLRRVF